MSTESKSYYLSSIIEDILGPEFSEIASQGNTDANCSNEASISYYDGDSGNLTKATAMAAATDVPIPPLRSKKPTAECAAKDSKRLWDRRTAGFNFAWEHTVIPLSDIKAAEVNMPPTSVFDWEKLRLVNQMLREE